MVPAHQQGIVYHLLVSVWKQFSWHCPFNGVVDSLFNVTVYISTYKIAGVWIFNNVTHGKHETGEEKKQTTSLCLSTYFNILIRVLLLIKTLICRLHTMFYTHRHGKKTDDIYRLHSMFYTHRNGEKKNRRHHFAYLHFF